jgi:4-deoxy-L-threo-5-hexosulose-uronate ketol-isomerase
MPSCQLVMGYTSLEVGSVWNTMPSHTHDRRMEAYLYWGMDEASRVLHLMGEPTQTRHMFIANEEGAISPPWSIHSGAGIGEYKFIWAMAGDNVDYTDMDFVQPSEMK